MKNSIVRFLEGKMVLVLNATKPTPFGPAQYIFCIVLYILQSIAHQTIHFCCSKIASSGTEQDTSM